MVSGRVFQKVLHQYLLPQTQTITAAGERDKLSNTIARAPALKQNCRDIFQAEHFAPEDVADEETVDRRLSRTLTQRYDMHSLRALQDLEVPAKVAVSSDLLIVLLSRSSSVVISQQVTYLSMHTA